MAANSTNYGKLNELTKIKDDLEAQLMDKMERWEYLMAKAEEIEKQKQTWKEKTPEQIAVSKQKEYNTRKNNNNLI